MKAREVHAIYADRITITLSEEGLRVAFGEGDPDEERYHVAIFMTPSTARQFEALLKDSFEKHAKFNQSH